MGKKDLIRKLSLLETLLDAEHCLNQRLMGETEEHSEANREEEVANLNAEIEDLRWLAKEQKDQLEAVGRLNRILAAENTRLRSVVEMDNAIIAKLQIANEIAAPVSHLDKQECEEE